ncbi:hypothetical protein F4802DRAFT_619244 [Xylaria palmicola]|nr:hypothetical protein F4802DRAFT_619244 [Xylaria palmicola]
MAENAASVCDLISRWARETPNHPAILFGERTVTYCQLEDAASRIARIVLARQVRPGHLVPVLATRSCEMVASFLGVLKAGACYVPIDIEAWAEDRIVSTLQRVNAHVAINLSTSTYPCHHAISLEDVQRAFEPVAGGSTEPEGELPQASIQPLDLAYTIFTSGTTSTPKGVMIPHRALLNYVLQGDDEAPFNSCPQPEDKSLLTFSPGFDACAGVVFSTLCHGAQLMMASISEFESCAARATIIAVTPSMLSAIHDVESCSQLRLIIIGGEAPTQRLIRRWSAPGRSLYNGYGPTETTISSLMGKIVPSKPITLGRPMKNSCVLLLDGDTESNSGEICITGPGLAVGYFQDEELTAKNFIIRNGERIYRTGDFARRTEHGLEFAGRADSFVKNRGFLVNIDSQVIPMLLDTAAHTATAFMHRDRLVAFITPEGIDTRALRQNLLHRHDAFLVPDLVTAVPVLPLTPNGKADNRALYQLLDMEDSDTEAKEEGDDKSNQHSKMETLKIAISNATLMSRSKITDESSFWDLGGNSLAALKVLSYLSRRHFKLWLKDLLSLPTIQAVCDAMQNDESGADQSGDALRPDGDPKDKEEPSSGPMTALQVKMIQASFRVPGANYLLLRIRIPHSGQSVSTLNLKATWHQTLSRYAIFRTRFHMKAGLQTVERDLHLDWREEKTTLEARDSVVRTRSLEIRDKILSSRLEQQVYTPVNIYHLITVDGVGSTLLASAHHAQADGWSFSIILDEIQDALAGRSLPLEEPPQFLTIALAQEKQQKDTEGVSFWKEMLKNHTALPILSLPKPPPEHIPYEWTSSLAGDLKLDDMQLSKAARSLNITPSALLYTAWGLVLSNYTSSDLVAFGAVFSGRNIEVPRVERAVGPLLNTVPFPIEFRPSQTIQDALSAINNSLLHMLGFQWSAAEAMASMPGESINGTLQTLVVTEYDLPPTQDPMSWTVEREDLMEFRVTLLLEGKPDGVHSNATEGPHRELQAKILFDSSRYAQTNITKLLDHFRNALHALTSPQNVYLRDVRSQMMGADEKAVILQPPDAFEDEENPHARSEFTTIKDRFESVAGRWPSLCAIEFPRGKMTYQEVDKFADKVAARLKQQVHTMALDEVVVGILSDGSVFWVIAILATLKAGYICCPLDTSLPPSRIETIILQSQASVFLSTTRACQVGLEEHGIKFNDNSMIVVDEVSQQTFDLPVGKLVTTTREKDPIYLVFTSGSTGVPKGVPLHNMTVLNAIGVLAVRLFAEPGKRISQLSALGFDMALVEIFGSLCYGATLVLKDHNNPFEHIKHVNAMVTTPSFLAALSPDEYPNIDTVLLAGEAVTQKLVDTWSDKAKALLNIYGPSECGCASGTRLLPGVPVTIGRPLPGLKFYVLDHHQSLVPQGIVGEIYISGNQVTRGYWGNTNELDTKSHFISNPFAAEPSHHIMYRTGDLGSWDGDMNISYVGRIDNQVKVRGFRVELEEVENALILAGEGDVRSAAAIAVSNDIGTGPGEYGSRIVAFVAPADVDTTVLHTKLATLLSSYSRPSQVIAVSEMPMTANFKLDREKLKTLALATPPRRRSDEKSDDTKLNPTEQMIAKVWSKVLGLDGVDTISRDDDFLSLGGNSILALRSARLVTESIGYNFPIALLLRETILGRLAVAIDQGNSPRPEVDYSYAAHVASMQSMSATGDMIVDEAEKSSDCQPLSYLERQLFEAHTISKFKSAFNTVAKFTISGPLDIKKLAEAFLSLVRENPILRARYTTPDGVPARHISADCSVPRVFIGGETTLEELQAMINEPFDLANEQLIRVLLWNRGKRDERTDCVIITHHIITDEASIALMLGWTSERYKDLAHDKPEGAHTESEPNRPQLKGTYVDWARWLDQKALGGIGLPPARREHGFKYWAEHLQGADQRLWSHSPSQQQGSVSNMPPRMSLVVPPPLDAGMDANAQKYKYSQAIALAATALSLYAYLGRSEMILGVPLLNRDEPATLTMLGLFVDQLPIRVTLNHMNLGDARLLLNEITAELNTCIKHRLPYTEIRSVIANPDSEARVPPSHLDVMMVYGWHPRSIRYGLSLGDDVQIRDCTDLSTPPGSMYPLQLELQETEDGSLDIEINYDAVMVASELMDASLARGLPPLSIISEHKRPGVFAKA